MTLKVGTIFAAPIFAFFVLALWMPWATPAGALAGCGCGLMAAFLIAFWDLLTGEKALSFQWEGPIAFVVDLMAALAVSCWRPRRKNRGDAIVAGTVISKNSPSDAS